MFRNWWEDTCVANQLVLNELTCLASRHPLEQSPALHVYLYTHISYVRTCVGIKVPKQSTCALCPHGFAPTVVLHSCNHHVQYNYKQTCSRSVKSNYGTLGKLYIVLGKVPETGLHVGPTLRPWVVWDHIWFADRWKTVPLASSSSYLSQNVMFCNRSPSSCPGSTKPLVLLCNHPAHNFLPTAYLLVSNKPTSTYVFRWPPTLTVSLSFLFLFLLSLSLPFSSFLFPPLLSPSSLYV